MKIKIFALVVSLTLLVGILSGCAEEEEETPPSNNAPEASFNVSEPDNMTVEFTDTSTDADDDTLTWFWDFGDDETSTEKNPSHTYDSNGIYTVILTVNDGTDTDTKSDVITIGIPPTADIIAPEGDITVNTTVQFMDNSTKGDSNITNWFWSFGDGITSTEQNPTHNYTVAATYIVLLTVSDNDGLYDTIEIDITVIEETI